MSIDLGPLLYMILAVEVAVGLVAIGLGVLLAVCIVRMFRAGWLRSKADPDRPARPRERSPAFPGLEVRQTI